MSENIYSPMKLEQAESNSVKISMWSFTLTDYKPYTSSVYIEPCEHSLASVAVL